MIGECVSHLNVNGVRNRRYFQQIIRPPFNSLNGTLELRSHAPSEINDAPRQQRRRKCHRKTELYVVAGVIIASGQVQLKMQVKISSQFKNLRLSLKIEQKMKLNLLRRWLRRATRSRRATSRVDLAVACRIVGLRRIVCSSGGRPGSHGGFRLTDGQLIGEAEQPP